MSNHTRMQEKNCALQLCRREKRKQGRRKKNAPEEITNVCQEESRRWPISLRDKPPGQAARTPNALEVTQYLMH